MVRPRAGLVGVILGLALGLGVLLGAWVRGRPGSGGRSPSDPPEATREMPDVERLRARRLALPLTGLDVRQLRDSFGDPRDGGAHEALDIPAPRGTHVVAVEDGVVARLFTSARGGLTVYQYDSGSTYCYYYAHLDSYAPGLREGLRLRRGDLIGFVGTTGNAPPGTPHLHFAIFRLGTPPRWWEGTPVNPYLLWADPGPHPL